MNKSIFDIFHLSCCLNYLQQKVRKVLLKGDLTKKGLKSPGGGTVGLTPLTPSNLLLPYTSPTGAQGPGP
jgi:hypothetical protein